MLVVGLGNPGREYVGTRHNVGRDLLLNIARESGFSGWLRNSYANAYVVETEGLDGSRIIFTLPETFMNRSGEAVRELVKKYGLQSHDVVVVYDDIDLPVGTVKVSKGRGDGGHNGIKSVMNHLGSRDFVRIRIGICPVDEKGEKNKPPKEIVRNYVLGRFSPAEREKVEVLQGVVTNVIGVIAARGVAEAMNRFN